MNKIFKVVWSKTKECYVVVSEVAKNNGGKKKVLASVLAGLAMVGAAAQMGTPVQAGANNGGNAVNLWADKKLDGSNNSANTVGANSVAVGNNLVAGDPTGATNGRTGGTAIAIGVESKAKDDRNIAIGYNNTTEGQDSFAMGSNVIAGTGQSIAIGSTNVDATTGVATQTIARGKVTMKNGRPEPAAAIAIGAGAQALDGSGVLAMGQLAKAVGNNDVAIGTQTKVIGNNSTAIGSTAQAIGNSSAAYGTQAVANGLGATAVGPGASAGTGDTAATAAAGATAVGRASQATKEGASALGWAANASVENAAAIGRDTTANIAGGVALGYQSVTTTAAGVQGYNPADSRTNKYSTQSGAVGTSTLAAVSVGNGTTATRQITGLAAGTADTDAVNVAQLKNVNLKYAADTGNSDVLLKDGTLTVNGDNDLISTAVQTNGAIKISAKVGGAITANNDGKAVAPTTNGIATTTNVTDAINNSGWKVTSSNNGGTVTGTTTEKVSPGDTVTFRAGKNIVLDQNGKQFTYSLDKTVDLTNAGSLTVGGTKVNNDGVTITAPTGGTTTNVTLTNAGLNNGGNKIVNVKDGDVSATSKDAVNGSQLHAVAAKERHIKPGTYTVTGDSVTLNYVDGEGKDDTTITAKITGITDRDLSNISNAGETKIKNLAKSAINMEDGKNTKASKRDVNGVDTYKVDVEGDLTGISSITNGGTNNGKISFGPNKTVTVDGDHSITLNASTGTIGGLQNKTFDPTNITSGQAATEDQLKSVHDTLQASELHIAPTASTLTNEHLGGTASGNTAAGAAAQAYKYDATTKQVVLEYNDGTGANKTGTKAVIDFSALNTGAGASSWNIASDKVSTTEGTVATGSAATQNIADGKTVTMKAGKNLTVKQENAGGNASVAFSLDKDLKDLDSVTTNKTITKEITLKDPNGGTTSTTIKKDGDRITYTNDGSTTVNKVANLADEKHITPGTYSVDSNGKVTMTYTDGNNTLVPNTTTVIDGLVTKKLDNIDNDGKKTITGLGTIVKAGDNVTVSEASDATTGQKTYTVNAVTPAVYTKTDGTKVVKRPNGTYTTNIDGSAGNDVPASDVIISFQDAAGDTKHATSIVNNVGSAIDKNGTSTGDTFLSNLNTAATNTPNAAVNVRDLKTTSDALIDKGLRFDANEGNEKTNKLGSKVTVQGSGAVSTGKQFTDEYNTANIRTNISQNNGDTVINVGLAKALKDINSISNGGSSITLNSTPGGATNTPAVQITGGNLSMGDSTTKNKIVNLAPGTDDNDAVNYSQIKGLRTEVVQGSGVTVAKTQGTDGHDIYTISANATGGTASTESVVKKAAASGDTNIADISVADNKNTGDAGAKYEVSVSRNAVKDAAREAVTVNNGGTTTGGTYTADTNNPISVTATPDNTNHNTTYAVTFDGDKAAKQIPLTYKATNNGTTTADQTVKLDKGLNFTGGNYTTASVGTDGKVTFDVTLGTTPTVTDGKPGVPGQAGAAGKDGIATVKTVVDTINNSGWKANAKANGGTLDGNSTATVVKPGEQVNFAAGKNLTVKQDVNTTTGEQTYTYSLAKDIDADTVVINGKNGKDGAVGLKGADGVTRTISITTAGKDGLNGTNGTNTTRIVYQDGNNKHEVATLDDGMKYAGDDAQGTDKTKVIAKKLNETLDIIGGANKADLTTDNIGVNNDGNGKLLVQLSKNLKGINTIKNGNTTITLNDTPSTTTPAVTITGGNLSMGDSTTKNKIVNLAPGTDDNDAVNVKQLKDAKTVLADGKNTTKSGSGTAADPYKVNVEGDLTGISSITNDGTNNGKISFGPNKTVTVDGDHSITLNASTGKIGGLQNKTFDPTNFTSGQAATEDQLNSVHDTLKADELHIAPTAGATNTVAEYTVDANNKVTLTYQDGNGNAKIGTKAVIDLSALANKITSGYTFNTNAIANGGAVDGSAAVKAVDNGGTINYAAGKNLTVKQEIDATNKTQTYTYSLDKDINVETVTVTGQNGKDGKIGINGKDGTNGVNGTNRVDIQVEKGVDGIDGKNGTDGISRIVYEDKTGKHTVATMDDGLKFTGNNTGTVNKHKLGSLVKVQGEGVSAADEAAFVSASGNIAVTAENNDTLTIRLNKNLKGLNSIQLGGNTIQSNGDNITFTTNGGTTKTVATTDQLWTIQANGIDVPATNGKVNVVGKDGITVAKNAAGNLEISGTGLGTMNSFDVTANNGATTKTITDGKKVDFNAGSNLTVKQTNDANGTHIEYALNKDVDLGNTGSLTTGNTTINNDGFKNGNTTVGGNGMTINNPADPTKTVSLTKDGLNNGGNQITNVASGGNVDTNAANIGDIKRLAKDTRIKDDTYTVDTNGTVELTYVDGAGNQVKDASGKAITAKITGLTTLDSTRVNVAVNETGSGKAVGSKAAVKVTKGTEFVAGDNLIVERKATPFGSASDLDNAVVYSLNSNLTRISSISNATNGPKMTIGSNDINFTGGNLNMNNNKITNVDKGTDSKDAANVGQLTQVKAGDRSVTVGHTVDTNTGANIYTITANPAGTVDLTNVNNRVDQLGEEIGRVGAQGAALSALKPIQYDPLEPTQIMAGYGNYRGTSAIAMGVAHYKNESTLIHGGISWAGGSSHMMANAGVTWKVGNRDSEAAVADRYRKGPISSAYAMQQEMAAMKAQNAGLKGEVSDLKAENEQMKAQIAAMMAKLGL